MLKEALAANTIGGKVDEESRLRAATEEARQAQASWARIGPVPETSAARSPIDFPARAGGLPSEQAGGGRQGGQEAGAQERRTGAGGAGTGG